MYILTLNVMNGNGKPELLQYLINDGMKPILTGNHPSSDDWLAGDTYRFFTSEGAFVEWPKHRIIFKSITLYVEPAADPAPTGEADEAKLSEG